MAIPKKVKKVKQSVIPEPKKAIDTIYLPDRDSKIAELAYLKAESRGFEPGQDLGDWFEAEQEFSF